MQKIIARLKRGSVLVYSLIILSIMLATAISIAGVSVMEKKASLSTAGSTQAFMVADSGSELMLQIIANNPTQSTNLSNLSGWNCDPSTGNVSNIDVVGGQSVISFFTDSSSNDPINCSTEAASLSQIKKIKSVGTYSGSTRAVEVAVASIPEGCQWYGSSEVRVCGPSNNYWCAYTTGGAGSSSANKLCDIKTGGKGWAVTASQSGTTISPYGYDWKIISGSWGWTTSGNTYI